MALQNHQTIPLQPLQLQQVLVLRPPYIFTVHEQEFLKIFHMLKAYDSSLPTHDFLHAHAHSVKVVLCSGIELGGKRVGIVELGNIGSRVATRLEAMGCIVLYTSRQKNHSIPFTFYPNVLQLAFDSDALVLCCALTDDTRHMINKKVMMALGKKGVIVNVARGALIDGVELVKRLVEGEIGGVGLDVFENEPNVPKELFELDNVVLSPHSTAFTKESLYDAAQVLIGNLEAFFMNKPLLTPVANKF